MIMFALATIIASPVTLPAIINAAKPGDRIILAAGDYPAITIPRGKVWSPRRVTIDARKARINSIVAYKVAGVTFSGGTVTGPAFYGVSIRDASRVSVLNMDISGATRGIVINTATDLLIRGNRLHGLRTDGIDVVGQRIIVSRNIIADMHPLTGDHPDGIQLWSAGIQTTDVRVIGNTIDGAMQGVFGRTPGLGLTRITVTGNIVRNSYPNGIAFEDITDSVFTGNDVRWNGAAPGKSNMRVEGTGNRVCGNAVPDVPRSIGNVAC